MKNEPFIIERILNAPIAKVWSALTSKDEMKQWYFDIAAFQPKVGFEFNFTAGNEGRTYTHLCKITEVVEGKKLTYSWQYKGYEGISYVSFELFEEGNKTKLKLTHQGLETFANNGADFQKESFSQGWNYIIGKSLPGYLEKTIH
jgi:uncharacterized protein YndB with AHSA1/START domain